MRWKELRDISYRRIERESESSREEIPKGKEEGT